MGYLFIKLFWFIALAFLIGIAVGWVTCGNAEDDHA